MFFNSPKVYFLIPVVWYLQALTTSTHIFPLYIDCYYIHNLIADWLGSKTLEEVVAI